MLAAPLRSFRHLRAAAVLLSLGCSMLAASAQAGERHALWSVQGEHNTVYLLGSIHLLRESDAQLPPAVLEAYGNVQALLMELEPAALGGGLAAPELAPLTQLPEGRTLEGILGADLYARFRRRSHALGVRTEGLQHSQPWFAATVINVSALMRVGFDPDVGVDRQLARLAERDSKQVEGLETAAEQLGFFAAMSLRQQRAYLRDTLEELDETPQEANATVRAWRRGDVGAMEKDLRRSERRYPDLQPVLVDQRNRRWLPHILGLLQDDQNYMVVVGALHLVGHEGLLELLRQHGYRVAQM